MRQVLLSLLLITSTLAIADDQHGSVGDLYGPLPYSGLWWDPERAGSGVSVSFAPDESWFVVVFGHTESGDPVFLTAQGEGRSWIEVLMAPGPLPGLAQYHSPPYGLISGTLLETRDGPCLSCDVGEPTTAPGDYTFSIMFWGPEQAELFMAGNTWNLRPFGPIAAQSFDRTRFVPDRHYAVSVGNADDEAIVLARGTQGRGVYIGTVESFSLECLGCDAFADPEFGDRIRRMVEGLEGYCPLQEEEHCILLLHDGEPDGSSVLQPGVQYSRYPMANGGITGTLMGNVDSVPWAATHFEIRLLPSDWKSRPDD